MSQYLVDFLRLRLIAFCEISVLQHGFRCGRDNGHGQEG
jgi:hypothetical protein